MDATALSPSPDTGNDAQTAVAPRKFTGKIADAARGTVDASTVAQVNMNQILAPNTPVEHGSAELAWQQQQARAQELALQQQQAQHDLEQQRNQLMQERMQLEQQRFTQAIDLATQQQQQNAERLQAQLHERNQEFHTLVMSRVDGMVQQMKQLQDRIEAQIQPTAEGQGAEQPVAHAAQAGVMVVPMQPELTNKFWNRMCFSHSAAQLSIAENQSAQHLVMEGPALGERADNQWLEHQAHKQLEALPPYIQRWRKEQFARGMKPVAVIGTVHVLQQKTTEECSICGCKADNISRRKATFRCGGPASQPEWEKGAQEQLHALRHGQLCAKCTGTLREDDGHQPWLVYDAIHQEYRAPSREEQVLGMQEVERRRWEEEQNYLDFEHIPNHRKRPPPTPGQFSTLHNSPTPAPLSSTTLRPGTPLALTHEESRTVSFSQDVRQQPHMDPLGRSQALITHTLDCGQDYRFQKTAPTKKAKSTPTKRTRSSRKHGDSPDGSSSSDSDESKESGPPGGGGSGEDNSDDSEGSGSDGDSRKGAGGPDNRAFETRDQAELRKRVDKTIEALGRNIKDNITVMDPGIQELPPLQRAKAVQRGLVQIRKLKAIARREIESLVSTLPGAHYTLVDKIMNRMLPKGSEIDQTWSQEVVQKHVSKAAKWKDTERVIPAWIIKHLIITDEDQKLCLEAAQEEMRKLARMAPIDAARIMLELRDIVKALGFGSQLTIPMVGAALARTLSNTVKARLSDWTDRQKQFDRHPRAKLDKLPSNYTRENLMKLVAKAQSFYRETARTPTGTPQYPRRARVAQVQETSDWEGGQPDVHEHSDDRASSEDDVDGTCAALRSQVGTSGPKRKAFQYSAARRGRYQRGEQREDKPKMGQLLTRSGTGSVMATDAVLKANCNAIVTDAHFEGCWNCGGKHYQRDCPNPPKPSTTILKALTELEHQRDIVSNAQLAATIALQGVSADACAVLPNEAQEALVAYLDSGVPELSQDWAKGVSNQA